LKGAWILVVAALAGGGCVVHTRALVPEPPELVVFGPPVFVATPVVHVHAAGCGHAMRWYGGRRVFYAGGRWEYVEGGRVYAYQTIHSHPREVVVVKKPRRVPPGHARHRDRGDDEDSRTPSGIRRYTPDEAR